jgi:hypothetical protein
LRSGASKEAITEQQLTRTSDCDASGARAETGLDWIGNREAGTGVESWLCVGPQMTRSPGGDGHKAMITDRDAALGRDDDQHHILLSRLRILMISSCPLPTLPIPSTQYPHARIPSCPAQPLSRLKHSRNTSRNGHEAAAVPPLGSRLIGNVQKGDQACKRSVRPSALLA